MPRQHDLDALRATAMLLGIGMHAAGEFIYARTTTPPFHPLEVFIDFGHGFRMPLFFLLSGFFTAMLWRRRGLRKMVHHRFRNW